jgi:glycosyltransferase involved in cell wall biosynthesis
MTETVTGSSPLDAGLVCEQLLQPIPGGIGTYVRALLTSLPKQGVRVSPIVAWHRDGALGAAGLEGAHRLPLPRLALYRAWAAGLGPSAPGRSQLVHAPSLAFPPRDDRPLVVTVHDVLFRTHPDLYPARAARFHERALRRLSLADIAICPSRATADDVGRVHPVLRVEVVPMGTDMTPPDPDVVERVLSMRGVRRPYVLWASTLEPRKNIERTIQGFALATEGEGGLSAVDLCLVGPRGWLRGRPAELLAGREDRVRWLGPISRDDLAALYAGAEAFLFPSLAEGFGLPVLEAMACGTPVITSDRSSLPEVARDAAALCDPTDPSSIAEALGAVLRDPVVAGKLRHLGLERAARFTWDRTARETASLYRTLT